MATKETRLQKIEGWIFSSCFSWEEQNDCLFQKDNFILKLLLLEIRPKFNFVFLIKHSILMKQMSTKPSGWKCLLINNFRAIFSSVYINFHLPSLDRKKTNLCTFHQWWKEKGIRKHEEASLKMAQSVLLQENWKWVIYKSLDDWRWLKRQNEEKSNIKSSEKIENRLLSTIKRKSLS